jgi:hypothetical protein
MKINDGQFVNELLSEIQEVTNNSNNAIKDIMLSVGRIGKYPPYNWCTETVNAHIAKGIRHLLTYQLQRDKQQKYDGEDHFKLGICRIAMAYSLMLRTNATANSLILNEKKKRIRKPVGA